MAAHAGANYITGHEPARLAFKVPHLPLKPPDAYDDWRWSLLQMMEGSDPRFLITLADEHGPLTLAELRAYVVRV